MRPELLEVGPFTLNAFGGMLGVALAVCWWFVRRDLQERGYDPSDALWLVGGGGVGGILGARAWFLATDPDAPVLSGSGLTFYGGLIGGALGVAAAARLRGVPLGTAADVGAPALAVGYAIGRMGCHLAGDGDYGTASTLPWAMSYPDGTVPIDVTVHPTPLYEAVLMLVVFWALWRLRRRLAPRGTLFALWAVLAGTERLLIETIRRNPDVALGLTSAQITSLALIAGGAAFLAATRERWWPPRPVAAG